MRSFAGVNPHVYRHRRPLGESLFAVTTNDGFLPGMKPNMIPEGGAGADGLAAGVTRVAPLPGVCVAVNFQRFFSREHFPAHFALVRFIGDVVRLMDPRVFVEDALGAKGFAARRANVPADAVLGELMGLVIAFGVKTLLAKFAKNFVRVGVTFRMDRQLRFKFKRAPANVAGEVLLLRMTFTVYL